jgi:putative heme iron utilization protein
MKDFGIVAALIALACVGFVTNITAISCAGEKDEWEHKDAVELTKEGKIASLGTIDKLKRPYVSLTPYALDSKGRPFVFISDLAFHTRNLKDKPEASLMVSKLDEKDIFNSARITFIGEMKLVDDKDEVAALKKVYFAKYKGAKKLEEAHDFNFYRMDKVDKLHYIGGFGDIRWIPGKDWLKEYK